MTLPDLIAETKKRLARYDRSYLLRSQAERDRAETDQVYYRELLTVLEGRPRFTVLPPYLKRKGKHPIETTAPCLYTQVRSCKEEYPDDADHWCSYCTGLHTAGAACGEPAQ